MSNYFTTERAPSAGPKFISEVKKICPFVFLVCFRSKNKNAMVYQLNVKNGKVDESNPVISYWLSVDEEYRQSNTSPIDKEPLNMLDKKVWKHSVEKVKNNEYRFKIDLYGGTWMRISNSSRGTRLFIEHEKEMYISRSLYICCNNDYLSFAGWLVLHPSASTEKIMQRFVRLLTMNVINIKTKKSSVITIFKK
jgi:hypothetical protein